MSKLTQKIATVSIAIATVAALSGPVFAQSTADLQAQIAALLAQINSLQSKLGTASVGTSSYNFATNLTLGSKGADVTALQNVLISGGFLKIAAPTAYFGAMTKSALAAWQSANGVSPAVGYFGAITRAKMNSMATASTGTQTGGTVIPVSGGAVSVGLASDNPVAQSVMIGNSQIVPVLSLNFSAGSSNVTVTGLNVIRAGLSSDQELNNVYLLDGSKVIATNLSISNGVVGFSNASGLFTVNMNSTKKITVAVSIVTGTASGHTYQFSLASASAVTSNASSVQGSFPVSGNTLTSASVSNAGGVTITNNSSGITSGTGLTVNAGQVNYIAGQFTLQANNQTVSIRSLKLTLVGSVNPTDLANIKLYNGGTQLGGTLASIDANNVANFDLSASPLQLTAGQTVQLYVYADVNGTVSRYFQFSVQHNYDVIAQDLMYNVGVLPASNTGTFPVYFSYVNVQTGTLTVTRNAASPVNYVLPGGTNQAIAKIDMKAVGEAVRITALNIDLTGTTVTTSTITNVKVVDDQGTQIGTTQQTITAITPAVAYTNLNYVISSGATRTLTVYADLGTTATGNVIGGLTGVTGQGYTSLAALSAGSVYGNTLSANATLLSVFLNSALGNTTVVAGQNGAKVASFSLVAGAASDVSVSSISMVATSSPNFQNLTVKVAGAQVGQVQPTISNGTTYNFSFSSPVTIPKGGQLIVDAYADVKTTATTTYTSVPVYIPATTGVSATAVSTSQVISGMPAAQVNGQTITTAAAGTATYALSNTPAAGQIGMGSTGVVLATYKVTGSANEAITLNTVYLQASSTVASVFTNLRLVDAAGKQWGSSLNLAGASTSSTLSWVGVNIPVAQNGYVTLSVVGDASSWQALQGSGVETASANATTSAAIYQVDFIGGSSNTSGTSTVTGTLYGNAFDVLRTTLTPAAASGVTFSGGQISRMLVGAFTLTAGLGNDVTLATTSLSLLISNASTSVTTTTITVRDMTQGIDLTSGTTTINGVAMVTPISFALSPTISAGQMKTYYVYVDTSAVVRASATQTAAVTAQASMAAGGVTWSDGTRTGLLLDSRFVLPISLSPAAVVVAP